MLGLQLSCPIPLDLKEGAQGMLHDVIIFKLSQLRVAVQAMPVDASDDDVMESVAPVLGMFMKLTALRSGASNREDIVSLSQQWILSLLVNLTGNFEAVSGIDSERLKLMLCIAYSSVTSAVKFALEENVRETLQCLGCKEEAVAKLTDELARKFLQDLRQWDETNEEETFTSRPLVEAGRLTPGLGLFVYGDRSGPVHIFVYDLVQLRLWAEINCSDPSTRLALRLDEIIEIS